MNYSVKNTFPTSHLKRSIKLTNLCQSKEKEGQVTLIKYEK